MDAGIPPPDESQAPVLTVGEGNDHNLSFHIGLGLSISTPRQDIPPRVRLRQHKVQLVRRHSTQLPSAAVVYPVADDSDEVSVQAPAKPLRRSLSTRVLRRMSSVQRFSFASESGATPAKTKTPSSEDNGVANQPAESPYEEMMVRFQIRELQRTASSVTVKSDDRRCMDISSRAAPHDAALGQQKDDNMPPRLTARNRDHTSSPHEVDERTVTFQRAPEQASMNHSLAGGHPPFESSAQLAEQFDLGFGRAGERRTRPGILGCLADSSLKTLRGWQRELFKPISPYSKLAQARYAITLVATAIYVLWFPLELAFPDQHQLTNVDAVIGAVLGLDLLMTLHTSYVTPTGTIIFSHRLILWHYMKTRFFLDVTLSAPLVMHANHSNPEGFGGKWVTFVLDAVSVERLAYITRFVRMIWLIRANQSGSGNNFWAWLLYSRYSHLVRIASIAIMLITIAHYIACIWTVLLYGEGDPDEIDFSSWRDQYSSSFYAALLLLQGEGVPTDTAGQNLFASLSVLIGSIVLAVVFGHVAILVANFNANSTNYQRKMEAVMAMTTKLQLPGPLQERIHEYYEHLWHEYECLDGEIVQFSKGLSHTLGLEVVLFKYMELVMHVSFWKDCTPDFQKQLMLHLDVRVYLPNDFIMREGEVDDEFYMVNRGYCELSCILNHLERVTNTTMATSQTGSGFNTSRNNGSATARRRQGGRQIDDANPPSAYELDAAQRRYYNRNGGCGPKGSEIVISRGQAFGDLALLMNYQRSANVRAITHVEICVLSRENFQAVLARYPEDRHRVVVDMLTSDMQRYELNQSGCPRLELVRSVYSPENIAQACAKAGSQAPLFHPVMTARQAAERIYSAINIEMEDVTLKFGVGINVRDQLIALRDRRRQKCELKRQVKLNPSATSYDSENASSKGRLDSGPRLSSEVHANDPSVEPKPAEPAPDESSTIVLTQAEGAQPLSLQERLRQMVERETEILRALQELQSNLNVLRAG